MNKKQQKSDLLLTFLYHLEEIDSNKTRDRFKAMLNDTKKRSQKWNRLLVVKCCMNETIKDKIRVNNKEITNCGDHHMHKYSLSCNSVLQDVVVSILSDTCHYCRDIIRLYWEKFWLSKRSGKWK